MNQRFQEHHEYSRGSDRPRDQYGRFESEGRSRYQNRGRDYEDGPEQSDRYDDGRSGEYQMNQSHPRDEYGRFESTGRGQYRDFGDQDRRRDEPVRFTSDSGRQGYQNYDRPRDEYGRFESGGSGQYQRHSQTDRARDQYGRFESSSDIRSEMRREGNGHSPMGPQRGQFAGKGPKGYKRSDDRIEEEINEALTQNSELDPSEIEVKVHNGVITLSGTVSDRHYKRMAEDIAEQCSGVQDVRNEIHVRRESETATTGNEKTKSQSGAMAKSA